MSSKLNAAGLTPEQSKALKERPAELREEKIIAAIKELYSCNAQAHTFSIYADTAVFCDPIGIARGKNSIHAQFMGLAKTFEKADIPKFRILQNPPGLDPLTILIDQDVVYYRKASEPKTINSLLTIRTDSDEVVTSHTEEWNHDRKTTSDDGFLRVLNEQRRKATAGIADMFVGAKVPKN